MQIWKFFNPIPLCHTLIPYALCPVVKKCLTPSPCYVIYEWPLSAPLVPSFFEGGTWNCQCFSCPGAQGKLSTWSFKSNKKCYIFDSLTQLCPTMVPRTVITPRTFIKCSTKKLNLILRLKAREGVIIEWPLNGQFNDAVTDVLTSRTDVREVVDHDDDHELTTFLVFWLFLVF